MKKQLAKINSNLQLKKKLLEKFRKGEKLTVLFREQKVTMKFPEFVKWLLAKEE